MSFNNLKLKLLLELLFNYYLKNYLCQYCTYDCYYYKLLQINSINKRKRKTYLETRFYNPIRRTLGQQQKERTTENQEKLFRREITKQDSILIERKSSKTRKPILTKKSLVSQIILSLSRKNLKRI